MISAIMKKDHQGLMMLNKAMKPEERLLAFFNHSRLIHRLYQAGKKKQRLLSSKITPRSLS
jgi:hypothetical protein